ncbi:hypothetical protein ACE193_21330 [Bernardetia sp. OM2101]|uniref:hypothetical protein n=1 Tax=Bernardetia sp. OM2101 TaxID=3344876 RepID=UPI0035D02856
MKQILERFWLKSELENFTPVEIALFHYLFFQISRGKDRHLNAKICSVISTSEKTLIKARENLIKNNIITYEVGSKKTDSTYWMGNFE